jgi:Holliday junction resolvase RusA-like endonuclease
MAKVPRTIRTALPTYQRDRQQWRQEILANVRSAANSAGVQYSREDRLEVVVLLYLQEGKRLFIHDVDNRLKDILDALQGRFFGSCDKKNCLIENDNQIYRVVIEKQPIPKKFGSDAGGRLLIRPYERHRWPLQRTKGS